MSSHVGCHVEINDLRLYYEEHGSGEPLLLIHGGTLTADSWAPHLSALTKHFRVIAPDSRGHGRTDNPVGHLTYRQMTDDMAGLIRVLGLDRPLVCGYSDGGQIALELGMRYSHLVRALVVGAAGYDFASAHTQATLRRIGLPAPGEADFERVGQTLGRLVDLSATHAAVYGPDWWKTLLLQLSVLWHTPPGYAPEDFARIQVPTLILMGDRDGWVSIDEAVAMYRMIPGAELAIVPDAGHAFPWMRPEAFTGVVLEFLLRHAASGTAR